MSEKERITRLDADIFTVRGVLTPDECRDLIAYGENLGFEAASVSVPGGPRMMPHVRNNDRVMFDDPVFAELMWRRVREFVPPVIEERPVVGLGERFRFYRYDPGQQFRTHRDGRVTLTSGARSRITFLIYLNTEYEGGETVFTDGEFWDGERMVSEVKVRPEEPGTALFFVHERWHAGAEVTAGRKYVLRTDVFYAGSPVITVPEPR